MGCSGEILIRCSSPSSPRAEVQAGNIQSRPLTRKSERRPEFCGRPEFSGCTWGGSACRTREAPASAAGRGLVEDVVKRNEKHRHIWIGSILLPGTVDDDG